MPTYAGVSLSAAQRKLLSRHFVEHGEKSRVGKRIGCTGAHLGQVLKGVKNPSEALLRKLCRELNLPLKIGGAVIDGVR